MMKTIFSFISVCCLLLLFLTGCEDSYNHPSEAGIPLAESINCEINVDQTTNEVTFKMSNPGCNPVWKFGEKDYSTVNGLSRVFAVAGTYQVEVLISNANGVSDGSVIKEFTIDNTIVDFTRYFKTFGGDDSKEWIIAKDESGHLACGESGGEGNDWWNAMPDEKEKFGVYDDILTFTFNKQYTYNPGAGGTVYVNKDCTMFSEYNTTGEDFMAPIDEKTVDYDFTVVGNDVYLILPPKSNLPYIPNDEIYNSPKFRISTLKNNKIELVADNGAIAWRYILIPVQKELSREEKLAGTWIWANEKAGHLACGESGGEGNDWWNAMPDEKEKYGIYNHQFVFTTDGGYTFMPGETSSFYANVACTVFPEYNLSGEDFNVPASVQNSTWKFVDEGANTFIEFPAKTIVGYVPNDAAWNNPKFKVTLLTENELKLVADNGEIAWQYYFIKEGSGESGGDDPVEYNPDSENNLWKNCTFTNTFFYAPGWNQIADPVIQTNGNAYTINLPQATSEQWQAQVFFRTDMSTTETIEYDFCATFSCNKDLGRVTVKLAKEGDDDTFFFTEMITLKAFEDKLISFSGMKGVNMEKVNLVLDFGGNPENTEVTISKIVLKDHSKE